MPPQLLGPDGEPIDRARLLEEQGSVMVGSVRQVMPEHPSWGLSPEGLASIIRQSESIDPSRWYALCDDVEEREWHYRGVLFQRRSALAQLPVTIDPASDDPEHVKHADFIREVVLTPEFTLTLMDLGDALGKGMAFAEIMWDTSAGQWKPDRIELRETTWFRYLQRDLRTPLIIGDNGSPEPLWPAKWIVHRARLKTGIAARDGLSRAAVWAWMFKNFDLKAWMIFLNKYGHPLRYGTYPAGTKKEEVAKLLAALRNLGLDATAVVEEGMNVQFVEASASRGEAFQGQATYLDDQVSKLVVGQTGTTDMKGGGGLGAGNKVHQGVREDICSYDGVVLSCTLARDLVRPCIDFNFGPQDAYPKLRIGLPESKNLDLILTNLGEYIDRGLEVEASQIYPLFGLTEPAEGDDVKLLQAVSRPTPGAEPGASPPPGRPERAAVPPGGGDDNEEASAAAQDAPGGTPDAIDALADEMGADMSLLADMQRQIEQAIDQSSSYEDLLARIEGLAKGPLSQQLVDKLALSLFNARLAGELGAPLADAGA